MTPSSRLFLAHASEDKSAVRQLYQELKARGLEPWLDEEDLVGGQIWAVEIPKAIRSATVFLACLSTCSVAKVGYVQTELREALSAYGERPAGTIYVIPLRLDHCEVPDLQVPRLGLSLRDFHRIDYWKDDGFERLVKALRVSGIEPAAIAAGVHPSKLPDQENVQETKITVTVSEKEEDCVSAPLIEPLLSKLEEQIKRAGNQMPENFPARAVLGKIAAARRRFGGGRWAGSIPPCLIGDMGRFFREVATTVEGMVVVDRPELESLRPVVDALLQSLQRARIDTEPKHLTAAAWPPGRQAEVQAQLQTIEGQLAEAQKAATDAETADRLDDAAACLQSLEGEAARPRPAWPVMRTESRELLGLLQPLLDPNSVHGQIVGSSRELFATLGEVADEVIRTLPDLAAFQDESDSPEMVIISAGAYQMGSPPDEEDRHADEGPQHLVTIAEPFALGRYPVTFEEYERFAALTSRELPGDEDWGRGRRPVIHVSWEDAQAYVAWLSDQTGKHYRLPSEAEWEYACRAETTTRYASGDAITPEQANAGRSVGKTTEVGCYTANAFRMHDMHGNVWEWCADVWHESYDGAPDDGSAWLEGGDQAWRVLRGGSFEYHPRHHRSAARGRSGTVSRVVPYNGFRVARTLR